MGTAQAPSGEAARGLELGAQTCSPATTSVGTQHLRAGPAPTVRLSPNVEGPRQLVRGPPFSPSQRSLRLPNGPAVRT